MCKTLLSLKLFCIKLQFHRQGETEVQFEDAEGRPMFSGSVVTETGCALMAHALLWDVESAGVQVTSDPGRPAQQCEGAPGGVTKQGQWAV